MTSRPHFFLLPLVGLTFLLSPLHAQPTTSEDTKSLSPTTTAEIVKAIGKEGSLKDDVYTIVIPRTDLDLQNDNGTIPIAAGIESSFHFYKCPCGKINVVGQFVVAEYESNDVIDALRKGLHVKITSVAPMLLEEKPRLLLIRFQGEGSVIDLAATLKSALDWTGEARMRSRKVEN